MTRTRHLLLTASALALLALTGCTTWRAARSVELAQECPLQVTPLAPKLRLLVVGDSTAVGTGASTPQASCLTGLLAARFPDLLIENRARDGATFAGVARQLAAPGSGGGGGAFDLVLVDAGGNDVIRNSPTNTVIAPASPAGSICSDGVRTMRRRCRR